MTKKPNFYLIKTPNNRNLGRILTKETNLKKKNPIDWDGWPPNTCINGKDYRVPQWIDMAREDFCLQDAVVSYRKPENNRRFPAL